MKMFETDDTGKVILYSRRTGLPAKYWPVDAKEILRQSDEYSTVPVPDKTKNASVVEVTPNVVVPQDRPKLTSMKKPELLEYSKKIGLDLEITMTIDEISLAIENKWEEQDEALEANQS